MKYSVLIPYKADFGRRDYLWSYVFNRYKQLLPQLELCVGVHQNEPFCKAKAINDAAKKANGGVFIIADSDVVFDVTLVEKIDALIRKHPWIIPFRSGIRLTETATDRLIKQGLPAIIQIEPEEILQREAIAGAFMNVITRACFEVVGGLDERFKNWGGEDDALAMALDTLCGRHYRLDGVIYHLWHPPAGPEHEYYDDNIRLFQQYKAASGDPASMRQLIQERCNSGNAL